MTAALRRRPVRDADERSHESCGNFGWAGRKSGHGRAGGRRREHIHGGDLGRAGGDEPAGRSLLARPAQTSPGRPLSLTGTQSRRRRREAAALTRGGLARREGRAIERICGGQSRPASTWMWWSSNSTASATAKHVPRGFTGPERGTQDAKVAASRARGFTICRCEPIGDGCFEKSNGRSDTEDAAVEEFLLALDTVRLGDGAVVSASAGESQFQNFVNFPPHKHPVDPFASVLTDCLRSRRCGGLAAIDSSRSIPYRRRPKPTFAAPQSTAMIASLGITCDWTYAQKLTLTLKAQVARAKR